MAVFGMDSLGIPCCCGVDEFVLGFGFGQYFVESVFVMVCVFARCVVGG